MSYLDPQSATEGKTFLKSEPTQLKAESTDRKKLRPEDIVRTFRSSSVYKLAFSYSGQCLELSSLSYATESMLTNH